MLTFFGKKPYHKYQTVLPVKKKKETILILFYILLHNFICYKLPSFCKHYTNFTLKISNRININRQRRLFFYALFLMLAPHFFAEERLVVVLDRLFSFGRLGDKKNATGCIKQVVVLYSNNCRGIRLSRLRIGHLTEVVV